MRCHGPNATRNMLTCGHAAHPHPGSLSSCHVVVVNAPCFRCGIAFKRAQFQRLTAAVAPGRCDRDPVIVSGAGPPADAHAGIAHSSPSPSPRASSAARSDALAPV
jgi:hypothetical protein